MTERMEIALNHIKTSVDVDPWAMEEVERVFKGIEDAITEIRSKATVRLGTKKYIALSEVEQIITKYTGVSND